MRRLCFTICLVLVCGSLSHLGCDKGIACEPPVITNKLPDTVVADNCNEFIHQFEADPGGFGGNANITWSKTYEPFGAGEIDSVTGLFTFAAASVDTCPASIMVTNDCSPPLADTCDFFILAETMKEPAKKSAVEFLFPSPTERRLFVFGPEGAESLHVYIETDGSTAELEAMGIKFRPAARKNIFTARISVEHFLPIRRLPSVVRVTPMQRGGKENSIGHSPSPYSPELDTSTANISVTNEVCEPPRITNLQDGDTLVADHCNKLSFQFEADPGGLCGGGQITGWDVISGSGSINAGGVYDFYRSEVDTYSVSVEVTNDCSPPGKDTCSFYVVADARIMYVRSKYGNWLDDPDQRREYLYGPEGAESLSVRIETNGTTADLDAVGMRYWRLAETNIYTSFMTVEQYLRVKDLPSIIRITPVRRQKVRIN